MPATAAWFNRAGRALAEQHRQGALVVVGVEAALVDVLADQDRHHAEPGGTDAAHAAPDQRPVMT